VYWTLLAADVASIVTGLALWIGAKDTGLQSGLTLQLAASQMVPFGWRVWCLFGRPNWFGEEKSDKGFVPDQKV
jgi:hypothetical protein